jgi:alkylhydroperoxidase family enzyme
MHLTIQTNDSAPEQSRPILEGIAGDLGFVPNMARVIATSPTLLTIFEAMRRAVGSVSIDPVYREIAGVAVGVAADNAYGVAFHSTILGGLGVDGAEIERMRAGDEPADPRQAAVYELAREIVLGRGKVHDRVITRAAEAGFSPPDILEVVAECAFASLVGTIDNLADRVELDGFLVPQAWK